MWPVICVPSDVASSSSSITDIGTIALTVFSPPIDSARVISQPRRAPARVARMTSLTVPPWTCADVAVVGQLGAYGDEAALLGEPAVHRRRVDRPPAGQGVGDLAHPGPRGRGLAGHRLGVGPDGLEDRAGPLDGVGHRVERAGERAGGARRAPVVVPQARLVRGRVEQDLADVDGLAAVDQDLVALGQQRHPALGQTLDEVALPQRAAAVERARGDAGHELAQLVHGAGSRQGRAAYVVAEVEVLVVDPGRVGETTRHRLEALAVARHERDPVGDQLDQSVVVEAGVARVEDLDGRVVHGRRGGLGGQEGQVPRPEPLAHPVPFRRCLVPHGILAEPVVTRPM